MEDVWSFSMRNRKRYRMEIFMRRIVYSLLLICIVIMATGCTKGDKVKKTTLYVDNNGKITEAIVESLDKNYYDFKELEDWIDSEVDAYNKSNGKVIDLKKCQSEDNKVKVTMEYDSMKDYSQFNNVKAFCGTIAEAEKAGYEFEGEFISAKDKPSITHAELEGSKKYRAIIVDESQTIVLKEEILYASSNVKVEGKNATVKTETNELAYIIYK